MCERSHAAILGLIQFEFYMAGKLATLVIELIYTSK